MKLLHIVSVCFFPYFAAPYKLFSKLQHQVNEELGTLYQGDIIQPKGRNAVLSNEFKWIDRKVPYVFDSSFTDWERTQVVSAMEKLTEHLCVKFTKRNGEEHYVQIGKRRELGCAAMVGRQRPSQHGQTVNLRSPECLQQPGIIQHELLHVLGLMHEQARPDRDQYINIIWDNIYTDYWRDFEKASDQYVSTYGVPYDYISIMHYPNNAFSKNGKNTIVAKTDPNLQLGQRKSPTEKDLEKVRRMYNCSYY